MEDKIFKKYSLLNGLNVSRETYIDFEKFISMIIQKNEEINIISKKTSSIDVIRERHIVDSAQIFDFIDLNYNTTYDIGTGGGMPGIVIAIMMKNIKKEMKINLYEKSYHKSLFLKEVSKELNLETEVIQKDIFSSKELKSGTIMVRAFKPLPIVLDLVYKNFSTYKNLILFMGKNGKEVLNNTLRYWNFDYKEKMSLTSKDSFLLNIKNIKKKKLN
ncbi:MAG: 16S rRNA (guanine527-N7)-methyltransferase [Pelagibacterales bacterium]|nr:16S rRNA (guanine527-N7)-methyltransferase [Pelagibacterales bacterium]